MVTDEHYTVKLPIIVLCVIYVLFPVTFRIFFDSQWFHHSMTRHHDFYLAALGLAMFYDLQDIELKLFEKTSESL